MSRPLGNWRELEREARVELPGTRWVFFLLIGQSMNSSVRSRLPSRRHQDLRHRRPQKDAPLLPGPLTRAPHHPPPGDQSSPDPPPPQHRAHDGHSSRERHCGYLHSPGVLRAGWSLLPLLLFLVVENGVRCYGNLWTQLGWLMLSAASHCL